MVALPQPSFTCYFSIQKSFNIQNQSEPKFLLFFLGISSSSWRIHHVTRNLQWDGKVDHFDLATIANMFLEESAFVVLNFDFNRSDSHEYKHECYEIFLDLIRKTYRTITNNMINFNAVELVFQSKFALFLSLEKSWS